MPPESEYKQTNDGSYQWFNHRNEPYRTEANTQYLYVYITKFSG